MLGCMATALRDESPIFLRRRDLIAAGWSDRALRFAVETGALLRPRAGVYLNADVSADVVDACALGGRLACVSELARRGVFVLDSSVLHVHLHAPRLKRTALGRPTRRHWAQLRRQPHPSAVAVSPLDAVACAVRCQSPRAAVATIDSALRNRVIDPGDLDELFGMLPRRYRVLRRLLDARAESGPESLVRVMLRTLGASVELQVSIATVGRVDFVVNGWLIVECDSAEHHASWDAQRRDRRRDRAAAALGYATLRLIAEDIMWHPDEVREALVGILASRPAKR